jgi:hypothetical protein
MCWKGSADLIPSLGDDEASGRQGGWRAWRDRAGGQMRHGDFMLEAEGEEQIGAMDILSQGALWVVPGLLGFPSHVGF